MSEYSKLAPYAKSKITVKTLGVEEAYMTALEYFKAGKSDDALAICKQILQQYPNYSPARHMKLAVLHKLGPAVPFTAMQLYHKAYFEVGDFSYGIPIVQIDRPTHPPVKLCIGSFCSFAPDVRIFLGDEHDQGWFSSYPFPAPNFGNLFAPALQLEPAVRVRKNTVIGNDVYIGDGVRIYSGVTIGDGAMIGIGAVITEDIPAYGIALGNPAQVVRYRFDPAVIALLQELQWWRWPLEKVMSHVKILCGSNEEMLRTLVLRERQAQDGPVASTT